MGTIVDSYNLFINSERSLSPESKGDNIYLPLGQTPITCGTDQTIRLTLQEFTMQKSWTNVNANNNKFTVRGIVGNPVLEVNTELTPNNYEEPIDVATDFASKLATALGTIKGVAVTGSVLTPTSGSTTSNSNSIIKVQMVYASAHGYTTGSTPIVQFYTDLGMSYAILGGKRVNDTANTTTNSLKVVVVDTTTLTFEGYYNAQTATDTHIYLRVNEQNTNIATGSLNSEINTSRTEMSSTKVLGIIPIDTDYVRYVANTEMVFFINILAKQVAQLQVYLTNSLGQPIPTIDTNQDTLGNRNFTCVLRVDILQLPMSVPHSLGNHNTEATTQARYSTAPSTVLRNGVPNYGKNGPQSGYYGDGFYNFQGKRIS